MAYTASTYADKKFVDGDDITKYDELIKAYISDHSGGGSAGWKGEVNPSAATTASFSNNTMWINTSTISGV